MSILILKSKTVTPLNQNINLAIKQHPECQKLLEQGYKLEATHEYTDKNGDSLFYRVRFKNPDSNEKWIRPVYFNGTQWVWKEPYFKGGKPLYGLDGIASYPDASIFICEGEWAADHLNEFLHKQKMYGANIATTSGSFSSANKADWKPLANHKIVIWPDNDDPGAKYAKAVSDNLNKLGCDVEMVDVKSLNLPEKGDVVDWLTINQNTGLKEFESIGKVPPNFEEPLELLFNIEEASVASFLKAVPLPRAYLLWECLPMGKVGLLVGMGGVRKSALALQMQISIATGKPLCGHWPIGERGASLGLYAEEDAEELHRRIYFAAEEISKEKKKLIAELVHVKSMVGLNNQMVSKEGYSEVIITDWVSRLIQTAKEIPNLKLIILDPASRFRGGDENSSTDTTRFVEACEFVAKETGATVLVLHHVNKSSRGAPEPSQTASRGSSALTDGARWQMNLDIMLDKEAKDLCVLEKRRKYHIKATVTKNNYAPPQEGDVWLELQGAHGILTHVELSLEVEQKSQKIMLKIISKVQEDASKGLEYSKSKFSKEYSGKDGIFKIGDQGLRGIIEQAIEKGSLVLKPPKKAIKNVTLVLAVADCLKEPECNSSTEDFSDTL